MQNTQWNEVKLLLPTFSGRGRPLHHPVRNLIDAIVHRYTTGCAWRKLPAERFPNWEAAYSFHRRLTNADALGPILGVFGLNE